MLTFTTFLQTAFQFVKSLMITISKKMYRTHAIVMAGTVCLTVVCFQSVAFGGGGKNVATASSVISVGDSQTEEEELEVNDVFAELETGFQIPEEQQLEEGQKLVAETLEKDAKNEQEARQERQDVIEATKEEIRLLEEEQRLLEEEAAKEAERKAAAIVAYSESDYEVLTRIVQAEASSEGMTGKILVANVILNRVRNSEFPNNITSVVFQKSQFSPISDGSFYSCKVTEETIEAVERALVGEDYSQGALYFMNRSASKSSNVSWFESRLTFLFQHNRHQFFK